MWMAERFAHDEGYRVQALGQGVRSDDHPLVVQLAANTPADFAAAAVAAELLGADGVDLNLGCPQTRAREGSFFDFRQLLIAEQQELLHYFVVSPFFVAALGPRRASRHSTMLFFVVQLAAKKGARTVEMLVFT
jgi:hypothetical protein